MFLALFTALAFLNSWVGIVVLLAYLFIISALFEDDWFFRGVLFLAVPVGIAIGIGAIGIPKWSQMGWIALFYLMIGIGWSFFRWIIFVYDLKKIVQKLISEGKTTLTKVDGDIKYIVKPWTELNKEQKVEILLDELSAKDYSGYRFKDHLEDTQIRSNLNITPNISNWRAKVRVASWIMYWPFSVLNYAYNRLLKDLVDFIIEKMKGIYNLLAANIMKGLQI